MGTRLEADEDEDDDEYVPANEDLGQWSRRDLGLVGSRVRLYVKPVLDEEEERLGHLKTASAMELYKLFQPDKFAEEIVYQSRLYAVQKNKKQALDIISVDTYRYRYTFIHTVNCVLFCFSVFSFLYCGMLIIERQYFLLFYLFTCKSKHRRRKYYTVKAQCLHKKCKNC